MAIKYEILVSRVYEFQKVEIKAISDSEMSLEEANDFRIDVAKLADEARRQLKLRVDSEKEQEKLVAAIERLEPIVSEYPLTEDGKFDVTKMKTTLTDGSEVPDKAKIRNAKEYRYVSELYSATKLYDYDD